jgi:hypothetical protein
MDPFLGSCGTIDEEMPEDEKQRVDRELIELLNELRVALPGAQVLFAFLLILPFTSEFPKITTAQRATYFGAFLCTAAAWGLFIAPSSYHRLQFRTATKERMLFTANRLSIAGTFFLALGIIGVVFLVTDVLFNAPAATMVTLAMAGWIAWFWFGLPLSRGRNRPL